MQVAIVGPDGSGKTSVCLELSKKINNSIVIYGGKRNFNYKLTSFFLWLWKATRKIPFFPSFIPRFFMYYPMEFLENANKFIKKDGVLQIYDRHPIDRLVLKNERLLNKKAKFFDLDLSLLKALCWLYKRKFNTIDFIFMLNPSSEVCNMRSNGQYKNLESVKARQEAYLLALEEWSSIAKHVCIVEISIDMKVVEVSDFIYRRILNV